MNSYTELLEKYCNESNYIIKKTDSPSNICYVFFSSNGLYKENNDAEILQSVVESKRFEWLSISSNKKIISNARKMIFVRDLRKIFYQKGINNEINSIPKLADFLNKETKGLDVYLVGSSAGGYIALLLSSLINGVKRVYSFGGCVDLLIHSSYYESKYCSDFDKRYSTCKSFISQRPTIIHFYGALNSNDEHHVNIIKSLNFENIIFVPFNDTNHAVRPTGGDIIEILTCSANHLAKIKKKMRDKQSISKVQFSLINIGFWKTIIHVLREIIKIGK